MPAIRPMPFSRRWRPRSLILVVSALALATAALVVAAVGFGRTIGVLTHWAGGPLAASADRSRFNRRSRSRSPPWIPTAPSRRRPALPILRPRAVTQLPRRAEARGRQARLRLPIPVLGAPAAPRRVRRLRLALAGPAPAGPA